MQNSLKLKLKQLSFDRKLVLAGSTVAFVSVFLPWYKDMDQFNTGDIFLGISGPLYITGLLVMLASLASFSLVLMKLIDKPQPPLPLTNKHFHVFTSSLSILMLVIAMSVYFHPKFGINLTEKSAGIGLYTAFIGAMAVFAGGFLKQRDVLENHSEHLMEFDADRRASAIRENPNTTRDSIHQPIESFENKVTDNEY